MSRFNPTNRLVLADEAPDLLAGGLLNSLTRPTYYAVSWGVLRSFIATIVTLGFVPMIAIIGWIRLLAGQHQQQCWHLAEWLRLETADPETAELRKSADRIRFSGPWALTTAGMLVLAACAVAAHFQSTPFSIRALYRFAFHMPESRSQVVFSCAMAAAALANLAHGVVHQQNIARFVRTLNPILARLGQEPIRLPPFESGLRPIWVIAGIALLITGAGWAALVMVAMAAHRRYTMVWSVRVRAMLAERVRAMLLSRRPAIPVPTPISIVRCCIRPNCMAPLPSMAAFCPRCGTKIARAIELSA